MPATSRGTYHDDVRLVARSLAGEQGAFRQLFETYSPLVFRIAYRMLGDREDASDLVQDIFIRVYERLHTLRDAQTFQAWLIRLAVNMAHDKTRRTKQRSFSLDAPPPGQAEGMEWQIADEHGQADARVLDEELAEQIQSSLSSLSHDHRIVVILHHLEEMPVDEISSLLKIPVGTVKSRLARARAELKRKLESYIEPGE